MRVAGEASRGKAGGKNRQISGFLRGLGRTGTLGVVTAKPRAAPVTIGRYAIHDRLAAGGMASVHVGRLLAEKGFSRTVDGKMDVEMSYDAVTGKSFRIVSQTGSNLLCDKVLKRAIDSEKEASQDKSLTAFNETNYSFSLLGTDTVNGRATYILHEEPRMEGKFLSRGKIWIDAEDFAVIKMETEPAKNPSFWISRTSISSSSVKTDGFWLPGHTRSETKVRIGGTAVLTIDYGTYKVVTAEAARLGSE